jgi:hypothetical protein
LPTNIKWEHRNLEGEILKKRRIWSLISIAIVMIIVPLGITTLRYYTHLLILKKILMVK